MDLATVRLNLSYVLHEPSTSQQVASVARQVIANERKARAAIERLSRLPDAEILRRVMSPIPLDMLDFPVSASFVTLQIGAWQLIPRVLAALQSARGRGRGVRVPVQLLDNLTGGPTAATPFFRAPAQLRLPAWKPGGAPPRHFVSLILRPGDEQLQLTLDRLSIDPGSDHFLDVLKASALPAESVVRSHFGQWFCLRPLWPQPAEQALPEFQRK